MVFYLNSKFCMKIWLIKPSHMLLMLILTVSVSRSFASGELLCASVFSSYIETNLVLEGVVYSPIHRHENKRWNVDRELQHHRVDLATGETIQRSSRLADLQNDDFFGFLPSPKFMETADLYQGFASGLNAFAQGAGRRVTPEESAAILANDKALFERFINSQRLGYAFVNKAYDPYAASTQTQTPHSAFIRVYDGTDYSRFNIPGISGAKLNSSPELPTEISMNRQNIKTDFFESYRRQGYQVFQIGKYVLSTELKPAEKKAARNEIFKWLLENYLDPAKMLSEKVVFVINVDSLPHEKTYRKFFGTTVVDPNRFDPPIPAPNAILVVEQKILRQRLLDILAAD